MQSSIAEYVNDISSDKSCVATYLLLMAQATMKKDKDLLIFKYWPEFLYVVYELAEQLNMKSGEMLIMLKNEKRHFINLMFNL